ncbi:MAG: sulfatase-like hydrolase/transferase [Planctomycetota bacterium]
MGFFQPGLAGETGDDTSTRSTRPPNIVLLLADDLGFGELSCLRLPDDAHPVDSPPPQPLPTPAPVPTPHIDSIARSGVRVTQGYVTGPNCSPSRAGLLTGRIPMRFGYEFNPIGARNESPGVGIPPSEQTLAEMLHDAGYATGLIGKWHLGGSAAYHPQRHGFDEFFGFTHEGHFFVPPPYRGVTSMLRRRRLPPSTATSGSDPNRWYGNRIIYTTHMGHDEPAYDANNPIVRGGQPTEETDYLTDALTREAVDFIERHADRPFFLYLAYNAVHSPLQAKTSELQLHAEIQDDHRRIFAAMLTSLDNSVGSVLQSLRDRSIERDTWVIFLSDNGGPTRELTSSNAPLRGEKSSMYEGGIRVPWLMSWPGHIPAGTHFDQRCWSPDLFATAAAVSGGTPSAAIDGVDLMPYLNPHTATANTRAVHPSESSLRQRPMFWRQGPRSALRIGDWKLVRNGRRGRPDPWELYDISKDVTESFNRAGSDPDRLHSMIRQWARWDAEMADPAF